MKRARSARGNREACKRYAQSHDDTAPTSTDLLYWSTDLELCWSISDATVTLGCMVATGGFLYEHLADELGRAIDRGALRAGDRLPSVRRLAQERSVSVATVLEAYLRLGTRD